MAQMLRQGTQVTVHIGPAIATGGLTAVTTLKASTVTKLAIVKHGSLASVAPTSVTGRTFTHKSDGYYSITLTSTDTNTMGHLLLYCRASGTVKALQMWQRFQVVPQQVYNSLATGGDLLQVDATQWAGSSTATGDTALKNTLAKGTDITGFTDVTASGVWAAATRTLTSVGVAWSAGTRTLTSAGVVWTSAARTLTSGANVLGAAITQVTGAPSSATPTLGTAMGWVYVASRYKRITTATADKLHSTASVGIAKAPITTTSTVFTRGKYVTVTG